MSFKYFAYGSNMLSKRMHINCPSAQFKGIALLKNFKFRFEGYSNLWKGAVANIVESPADSVWGVVWEISKQEEEKLDRQESGYRSIIVPVEDQNGCKIHCKTYQILKGKDEDVNLPSKIYKTVIIQGAIEHHLLKKYIQILESFDDNGHHGSSDIPSDILL